MEWINFHVNNIAVNLTCADTNLILKIKVNFGTFVHNKEVLLISLINPTINIEHAMSAKIRKNQMYLITA